MGRNLQCKASLICGTRNSANRRAGPTCRTERVARGEQNAKPEESTAVRRGQSRISLAAQPGLRLLSRYHARYPEIVVELVTGTTAALINRVMNFEIEAAFVSEPFTAPRLQARPVFDEQLVLITSRATAKVHGPGDLGRSTLIAFASGCSYRRRIEEWLGRENVMP